MPFTKTTDFPDQPAVKVFFSGLMILNPAEDAKSCEVFVNHSAPRHHLTIEVRRKRPNRPDEIMMRHVGPLAFGISLSEDEEDPPIHGFFIQKVTDSDGEPLGVRKYIPDAPPEDGKPDSLERAVNMSGAEFHGGNPVVGTTVEENGGGPPVEKELKLLDVDPIGGRPSIFIDDGIFYTAAKTRNDITVTLKKEGEQDQPLPRFASLIGAAIELKDGESVAVRWMNQGRFEVLELTRPKAGVDFGYEIYIINDPLYENDSPKEPKHDEFREYYKILPNVKTSEQFRLKVDIPTGSTSRGSTRAPCMSVLMDI
jgi:hypothetical protein